MNIDLSPLPLSHNNLLPRTPDSHSVSARTVVHDSLYPEESSVRASSPGEHTARMRKERKTDIHVLVSRTGLNPASAPKLRYPSAVRRPPPAAAPPPEPPAPPPAAPARTHLARQKTQVRLCFAVLAPIIIIPVKHIRHRPCAPPQTTSEQVKPKTHTAENTPNATHSHTPHKT